MSHAHTMDRIYRIQRHFYDATRSFTLLGRNALINAMDIKNGDLVLEMGCGTARNLIRIARRHPGARLFGLDASEEMLATARRKVSRLGLDDRVRVVRCFAEDLDRRATFGIDDKFDKVFFSYSLSMMPKWQSALNAAFCNLATGGALYAVDFWDQASWPRPLRAAMVKWLSLFHVRYAPGMLDELMRQFEKAGLEMEIRSILSGYAFLAVPAS